MLVTAKQPSEITLPPANQGWPTVLAFLCAHFPRIPATSWQQRIREGKVYWYQGEAITEQTPFLPSRRLCYFREVTSNPVSGCRFAGGG
jgi:tRNA pseudouridine32 synthase/23S rRNA pseudouridine746 synthase